MKAIGMHIFCGSQTIGHLLEGWKIDTVLEISEDMPNQNAYHFIKNYPKIQVKKPSEYEDNEAYLDKLKSENYDLLYSNPPCSGLSQINRNASADCAINGNIYKVINMVKRIEPKTFLIENAPTLTTTGLPILKDLVKQLPNYYVTIINDYARNHNVPMNRRRTMVVGFCKNNFTKMPQIHQHAVETDLKTVLAGVDYTYNKEYIKETDKDLFKYYKYVKQGNDLYDALVDNDVIINKAVEKIKYNREHNLRSWNKSPWRPDKLAPSMTSLTRIIHPTEDRDFYIREYAALMGYPNDFVFYTDGQTPIVQCIAQGVPVNFIRYISSEIKNSFKTKDFVDCEVLYINQCNPDSIKTKEYTRESFDGTEKII